MFVFNYDHTDYRELLHALAAKLGTAVQKDKLIFPRQTAIGFIQLIEMQHGLQAMAFDYTFTDNYRSTRKRINDEYYTLWFSELSVSGDVQVKIDNDAYQADNRSFSTALLTSSMFDVYYQMEPGTRVRGINVLLDNQWLAYHLGIESKGGLLQKYLSLKAARITMEPLDYEYKKLIQDVFDLIDGHGQFKQIAIQNRIMLLIERFFMHMAVKMETDALELRLSREDINRVMEVESLLVKDVFRPAPYIPELARFVNISETKLKNNFKSVFGIPIYQYFQKARMRAAREALETNRYSIKQVAREMGYSNLSNFTAAFKKEFGMLPSKLDS